LWGFLNLFFKNFPLKRGGDFNWGFGEKGTFFWGLKGFWGFSNGGVDLQGNKGGGTFLAIWGV